MQGSDFLTLSVIIVLSVAGALILFSVVSTVVRKAKAKKNAIQTKDASVDPHKGA